MADLRQCAAILALGICLFDAHALATDGGVAKPDRAATYVYESAAGRQTLVIKFLPKRRIAFTISRERKDGCRWTKSLTAKFLGVESYGLRNGDTTETDEYLVEKGQISCPIFVDLVKEPEVFADITATQCAAACALPEQNDVVMRLKSPPP
jgi:hypothetical protein